MNKLMREALAEAKSRSRANAAKPRKPLGPRTQEPTSTSDMLLDVGKSALTAGRDVGDSTLGFLGDVNDLRYDLADLIARSGPLDLTEGVSKARGYKTPLPTAESVHGATNAAAGMLPPGAQSGIANWTEHTPETPFGDAAYMAVDNLFDPTNYIGGKGIKKGFKAARKLVP